VLDRHRGWVILRYDGDAADLLQLRTTEDVFVLLFRTPELPPQRKPALALLTRMASNSRYWEQALTRFYVGRRTVKRVTVRVIAQMTGKHPFRRQELRDAVLAGVRARWPGWKPVADDAHLEVWTTVIGNWATIAIRLSDRRMRHRTYKVEHRPASLRPSLAAAMVALSRPRPDDRFCDPMCGTGTILAERALAGASRRLLGGDIDPGILSAGKANLAQLRQTQGKLVLHLWDARKLPVRSGALDVVVSNLPFGEQIGSHADNPELYDRFFRELERTLCPGGRAVLLTSEKELMRQLMHRHVQLLCEREILVGVLGQAARIYVLRRVAR
jgi:23S rRNA G2445 N2-methylase RlmL